MAASKTTAAPKLTEYKLPDGAVVRTVRPANFVRRAVAAEPETNMRFYQEIVAVACIAEIEMPAGYLGDGEDAKTVRFEPTEMKGDIWRRVDELSQKDVEAFSASFAEKNRATNDMVAAIIQAQKEKNAG